MSNDCNNVDGLNSRRYDASIYEDPIASPFRLTSLVGHGTGGFRRTLHTVYSHYDQGIKTYWERSTYYSSYLSVAWPNSATSAVETRVPQYSTQPVHQVPLSDTSLQGTGSFGSLSYFFFRPSWIVLWFLTGYDNLLLRSSDEERFCF
jgi:hypothetical protein